MPEGQPQQAEQTSKLLIDYKPTMIEKTSFIDLDAGFTPADVAILTENQLLKPSVLLNMSNDNDKIIDETLKKAGKIGQEFGRKKRSSIKIKNIEGKKY